MLTADTPTAFPTRPDLTECFACTIDAPLATVDAAIARIDLIGPLVDGLLAIGVGDHIVAPCANGLVWRFDRSAPGRVRLAWSIDAEAETDDASLVTLIVRVSTSDAASRERLLGAWPVLGPVVELYARRVLHGVAGTAEEANEDPFADPSPPPRQ
jgi:hypothetical protein